MRISDWSSYVCSSDLTTYPVSFVEVSREATDASSCGQTARTGGRPRSASALRRWKTLFRNGAEARPCDPFNASKTTNDPERPKLPVSGRPMPPGPHECVDQRCRLRGPASPERHTSTSAAPRPPRRSLPPPSRSDEHTSELQSLMRISY